MTLAPPSLDVVAVNWDEFLHGGKGWAGFERRWEPGQHVALIGPTGTGKSTFACGALPLRKWVLAVDPKGGDETLKKLEKVGFQRSATWPLPRKLWKQVEEGRPGRFIVGPVVQTKQDLPKLRAVISRCLDDAFDIGKWTLYIDELQIAADRRLMNLSAPIEQLLIAARNKGVSVVSSYQRPANVPRTASDQATWIAVFYTRDIDVVNRLAEMAGRPKAEIRGLVRGLDDHCILLFSRNPRDPVVVTRAARV